jgi:hypothetical protein
MFFATPDTFVMLYDEVFNIKAEQTSFLFNCILQLFSVCFSLPCYLLQVENIKASFARAEATDK